MLRYIPDLPEMSTRSRQGENTSVEHTSHLDDSARDPSVNVVLTIRSLSPLMVYEQTPDHQARIRVPHTDIRYLNSNSQDSRRMQNHVDGLGDSAYTETTRSEVKCADWKRRTALNLVIC